MRFDGKVVLVTGAASGIGLATATAFVEAGGDVILTDLNADAGARAIEGLRAKGKAEFHQLDVTQRADAETVAAHLKSTRGKLDVLVNAAGYDIGQPFIKNTPDFIDKVIAINYGGPVHLTQVLLPLVIDSGSGRIVNIASDAGRVGSSGETVYAGAKGGIVAFTKSLARETVRYGVRVNCVCPGPTDTPLFAEFAKGNEKLREALIAAIPMKRLAKPAEIADAILFFASDRASYVTGQVLSISGGLTMVD